MKTLAASFFSAIILLRAAPGLYSQSPVPEGAEVEKIAGGFQFVEGPVWNSEGYLLFSDINGNTVYKWSDAGGAEIFLTPSGKSNGLALDADNRLLLAQHAKRRVARLDADGAETALAAQFEGKKLNSPNDLAVKSDGAIYFTDPPWGISNSQRELDFDGIYRLNPAGALFLLDKSVRYPNGICFSPDESKLYVDNSSGLEIFVWDVIGDSTIANKRLFYKMPGNGAADGMKVDTTGNLYCAGPMAVWIFTPDGTLLDKIPVPETPTNLNWGGPERNVLYITASTSLYRIALNATGTDVKKHSSLLPKSSRLLPNYPNPFNPTTRIAFQLNRAQRVRLAVYNAAGEEIARPIDQVRLNAGMHELTFNADGLPSGIYFYRLTTAFFVETKHMTMLR